MDDPIFDPWCLGDDAWPSPSQRSSRWRSAGGARDGVPARRPPPSPIVDPRETEDDARFVETGLGAPVTAPGPGASPPLPPAPTVSSPVPAVPPPLPTLPPSALTPLDDAPSFRAILGSTAPATRRTVDAPMRRSEADAGARALRASVLPRLQALDRMLRSARHRTVLDDRLGQRPPSLRFRVQPWTGPFDDPTENRGAVLEVVAETGGSIAGRLWLDPLSESPTSETRIVTQEMGDAWVERLLLGFVARALQQA